MSQSDHELERSVLAHMFSDPESLVACTQQVRQDDFAHARHQELFEGLCRCIEHGLPATIKSLYLFTPQSMAQLTSLVVQIKTQSTSDPVAELMERLRRRAVERRSPQG